MSVVVLAYHELGCAALSVLLERGVNISAVFTHEDDLEETHWFGSVAELAQANGIDVYTPLEVNQPEWVDLIASLAPDVLFSFHYRRLVKHEILRAPRHGCVNLHASLLPRYRGRCPVNWQLVHGERTAGVTLHYMVARADAGDIIDQAAVEVGPDDTAIDLYRSLLPAAQRLLRDRLDEILTGTAMPRPQDEALATTFGGRRPEDGRIDWGWPATRIHDLVRAVARPWPGAFCDSDAGRVMVWQTRLSPPAQDPPALETGEVWIDVSDRLLVQTGAGLLELVDLATPDGDRLLSGDVLS